MPLSKNEIRVRYSGFIIFASQLISLLTGLVYTLLLTRNMTSDQFGVWSFISYLCGLFLIAGGVFPFWALRFVARGKEGAIKTAVTANLVVSLIAVSIYIPLVGPILTAFNISNIYYLIYLLAAVHIFDLYMVAVFEGCLQATKPQTIGYGLLIEEATKIALGYLLIVVFRQLFLGAIISLIVSEGVKVLFYTWIVKGQLRAKMQWSYIKEWLKGSTAYLYNAAGTQIAGLFLYLLIFFSGQEALGNYQAAVTFSAVISYASSLAFALYPKMLAGEYRRDLETSFKTMMMFALPMATVALTMSTSLLIILKASYVDAAPVLIYLTADALVVLVSQFYSSCVLGVETFDVNGKISLRQLVKSKIFKVFTLPYLQAALSLPLDFVILTQFVTGDPIQAAIAVVSVNIVVHTTIFVGFYVLMRKHVKIPVAWKSMFKYLFGAVVMALVLIVLPQTTTLAATFGKILAGVVVYTVILYAIDRDARVLVKDVFNELKSTFK
jgi:O-antigen/teichoic acid export membrane protein